jgi:NitT/TauT family transport system permease protein
VTTVCAVTCAAWWGEAPRAPQACWRPSGSGRRYGALAVLPADNAPSTWAILTAAARELARGPLATAITQTAHAWTIGFLVSVVVGVSLGVLVGLSRWADAATGPLFDFVRPIPPVALVPVAVILLGLGLRMQTFLIVFAAVWPILFNKRYWLLPALMSWSCHD